MVKIKLGIILSLSILIVATTPLSSAAHFITGLVNNASCIGNMTNDNNVYESSGSGGLGAIVEIWPTTACGTATTSLKISSGQSRWFKLVASVSSVSGSGTSESLEARLEGDAAFPVGHQAYEVSAVGEMGVSGHTFGVTGVASTTSNASANNNFVWSPTSTTSASSADSAYLNRNDWTNGYGVPGLPGTYMASESITKS